MITKLALVCRTNTVTVPVDTPDSADDPRHLIRNLIRPLPSGPDLKSLCIRRHNELTLPTETPHSKRQANPVA